MNDAKHLMTVFSTALDFASGPERVAYVDRACAGDPELRAGVEALLRAHDEAGRFLEPRPEHLRPTPSPHDPSAATLVPGPNPAAGTVVGGRYRLEEVIGEGGMGTVWRAAQTVPVRREVALKVIKAGMDSRAVLARFEVERQALAMMDHPNIARVLDGGTTAEGRPYFVMELVRGVPVTAFCDQERVPLRERLELFVGVCHAVQHAHQKGVIHRDLKPNNILVARYENRLVPKVIDFGIAKAAGQPLTDRSLFTGLAGVIGTPEYMSPEQAELNNRDIDTRSDIYTLGVLLYELLTGTTPLEGRRSKETPLLEVLRRVREEEPPTPSTRLSTAPDRSTIAADRGLEARTLTRTLRGELDWIVMRALEKDRNRRYQTSNALAADVQKYLANEPVAAGPPSALYRFRKFARRNRGSVIAASLVLLALVGGLSGTAWQALEATRQRDAKQKALDDAQLMSAEFAFETGQLLGDRGDPDLAILWLARSLRLAPQTAEELQTAIRLGLGAWQGRFHSVKAIIPHETAVESVGFEPDGCILTAGRNNTTCLVERWDPHKHARIQLFAFPNALDNCETALAFSAKADRLLFQTASDNSGLLRLFDLNTGREVWNSQLVPGRSATRAAFSPDGQHIIVGFRIGTEDTTGSSGLSQLFDAANGNPVGPAIEHTRPVFAVAFHPDGKSYVTECGYWANGIEKVEARFCDLNGHKTREPLKHPCMAQSVAFSRDGAWLLTGHADRKARLWDLKSSQQKYDFPHEAPVLSVDFSPDGKSLLTGSADGSVKVWNLEGQQLRQPLRHGNQVYTAKFSPYGPYILVGVLGENRSRLWEVAPLSAGSIHPQSFFPLAFSLDRKTTLNLTSPHTAQLHDAATGDPIGKPLVHDSPVLLEGAAIHPGQRHACSSDRRRALTLDVDNVARLWNVQAGKSWNLMPDLAQVAPSKYFAAAFSPDGKWAVTGNFSAAVQVWDTVDGKLRHEKVKHDPVGPVFNAAFHPAGKLLVTAGTDNSARFWDPDTGSPAGRALPHISCVFSVAFSPDGNTVATGGIDPVAQIWSVSSRECLRRLVGHRGGVNSLAFDPLGQFVLTGSQDKTARLWHAASGKPVGPPLGHPVSVARVAFHLDGKTLLTATDETIVRSWPMPIPVTGSPSEIERWAQVLTGMEPEADGSVRLLDAVEWQRRKSLTRPEAVPNREGR